MATGNEQDYWTRPFAFFIIFRGGNRRIVPRPVIRAKDVPNDSDAFGPMEFSRRHDAIGGLIAVPRYHARYNVEASAWEVFDTVTQTAVESFSCRQDEELKHYAEQRALAHSIRLNQLASEAAGDQAAGGAAH